MFDILTLSFPITATSLIVLAIACIGARWVAEVVASHLPERMNHEWARETADFRGEHFEQAAPRLRDAMAATGWLPQVLRRHLGGSTPPEADKAPQSRASGSKVDPWQLLADAIALFGPFAAVFAHKSIDVASMLVALMCWVTAAAIIIDRDHFLIPDAITMPMLWLGLLASAVGTYQTSQSAIASAALAYLALWGIGKLFLLARGVEGIGMGDAKWLAMVGAWFGAMPAFTVLVVSCFAGALYAMAIKQDRIAFGPMLSVATVAAGIWTLL